MSAWSFTNLHGTPNKSQLLLTGGATLLAETGYKLWATLTTEERLITTEALALIIQIIPVPTQTTPTPLTLLMALMEPMQQMVQTAPAAVEADILSTTRTTGEESTPGSLTSPWRIPNLTRMSISALLNKRQFSMMSSECLAQKSTSRFNNLIYNN